ncbi:MAG TPA: PQQ-binding-like beta-propeller repeat protein [Planctomycetota bacterium]
MRLTVAVLAASLPLTAYAQDYPTFRGTNRDGHSPDKGLAKEWPAGGPPLAWKIKGIGGGYGGVSTLGDKLFLLGDKEGQTLLHCLNAADGKIAWSAPVGKEHSEGNQEWKGNRATPTTDGKVIIALGPMGELVCFDLAGKEKWRKNLHKDFGGKVGGWKYSESPLIDGDHVVCVPGGGKGAVLALKKDSGDPVWQCAEFTDAAEYASLVAVELGGVRQYVAFTQKSVAGVAAKDGKLLWRADFPGKTAVIPTPIIKDDIVFVAAGYGVGHAAYKITATDGKFSAAELYNGKEMKNHHGGVILVGDHLYGCTDNNQLVCLELKTGKQVWADKGVDKGSLAYADGLLVARSEKKSKGTIVLVEASPAGYKEKGRFEQPDLSGMPTWPHPTIAGGHLYIRDQDTLLCYGIKAK